MNTNVTTVQIEAFRENGFVVIDVVESRFRTNTQRKLP